MIESSNATVLAETGLQVITATELASRDMEVIPFACTPTYTPAIARIKLHSHPISLTCVVSIYYLNV